MDILALPFMVGLALPFMVAAAVMAIIHCTKLLINFITVGLKSRHATAVDGVAYKGNAIGMGGPYRSLAITGLECTKRRRDLSFLYHVNWQRSWVLRLSFDRFALDYWNKRGAGLKLLYDGHTVALTWRERRRFRKIVQRIEAGAETEAKKPMLRQEALARIDELANRSRGGGCK